VRRFHCSCPGQPELFFGNDRCFACGRDIGFDPQRLVMTALEPNAPGAPDQQLRRCRNGIEHDVCNWLVADEDPSPFCASCRLNQTIPQLSKQGNLQRWRALEYAKRRLLYSLLRLGLGFDADERGPGLRFSFLEDQRTNPLVLESTVMTGHSAGHVTVNIAEADPAYREREREILNQSYRTLLGHLRHESGHYYFDRLVANGDLIEPFRALFGDEREDYRQALERFRGDGPLPGWEGRHISAYASAHPWEDWAECWAHYLHMVDTLETAVEYDVIDKLPAGAHALIERWGTLTIALNELNRSMGMPDPYPFVIGPVVGEKLALIESAICSALRPTSAPEPTRTPRSASGSTSV
jgi:hypothetical protein